MSERPILFGGEMVRAIRDGRKTMTRRVARLTPAGHVKEPRGHRRWHPADPEAVLACPYGQPGDHLWVRETFVLEDTSEYGADAADPPEGPVLVEHEGTEFERVLIPRYRATEPDTMLMGDDGEASASWRPSIFMPRWASRLTLRVEGVRIEHVQDITEADAAAEGCEAHYGRSSAPMEPEERDGHSAVQEFAALWDDLHAKRPERQWNANPFVWVVQFSRVGAP